MGILAAIALGLVALFLFSRKAFAGETVAAEENITFGGQNMNSGKDWREFTTPFIANKVTFWSETNGVDSRLTAAVIMTESSFNPEAENPADPSFGLMQVTPLIARSFGGWIDEMGVQEIKSLDINLKAGTGFLKHLLSRYGKLESAIQAYNLGETKFDKGLRVPEYLATVSKWYREFGGNI